LLPRWFHTRQCDVLRIFLLDACSDMIQKVPLTGMLIHHIFYSNNFTRLCSSTTCIGYFPHLLSRHAFFAASQLMILFCFHMDFSYPPPREKCAAPSCTNPYKYRDSKSKLPLCSLHCYKTIHEKMQPLTAC
jgi:hypothetical protein